MLLWCSPNPGKPLERSRRPHRLSVLTSSEAFCRAERPQIGKPQSLHRSSWWPRRCDHGGPLSIPWSTLQSDSGARQGITDDSSGTSRAPVAATKQEVESRLTDSCDSIKLFLLQENLWVIESRRTRPRPSGPFHPHRSFRRVGRAGLLRENSLPCCKLRTR